METLGQRIAKARGAKGWTQADLGKAIQRKPQQVSAWERDEGQPRAANLSALAESLGVRIEWLALGQGAMKYEGVREPTTPYSTDELDASLLGECCEAVLELLDRRGGPRLPAGKLGAAIAEVYLICRRDGRKPTDELVASFVRVLLA